MDRKPRPADLADNRHRPPVISPRLTRHADRTHHLGEVPGRNETILQSVTQVSNPGRGPKRQLSFRANLAQGLGHRRQVFRDSIERLV